MEYLRKNSEEMDLVKGEISVCYTFAFFLRKLALLTLDIWLFYKDFYAKRGVNC